jgi:hypothetical protein
MAMATMGGVCNGGGMTEGTDDDEAGATRAAARRARRRSSVCVASDISGMAIETVSWRARFKAWRQGAQSFAFGSAG